MLSDKERLARLEAQVRGIEHNIILAKAEVDRRLNEMNELRHQIDRERGHYLTIERHEERHTALDQRLNQLERDRGLYVTTVLANEALGALNKRLGLVESRTSTIEGGSQVKAATIGWVLAGMGLFLTVLIVIVNVLTGKV